MATPCARGCVAAAEAARAASLSRSQQARRAASAAARVSPRTAHRAAPQPAVRTRRGCVTVAMSAQMNGATAAERPALPEDEARPGRRPLRLFAISDVHTDFPANMCVRGQRMRALRCVSFAHSLRVLFRRRAWVESLSRSEYASDALIVAGDVSDDSAILAATLRAFKERFAEARSAESRRMSRLPE